MVVAAGTAVARSVGVAGGAATGVNVAVALAVGDGEGEGLAVAVAVDVGGCGVGDGGGLVSVGWMVGTAVFVIVGVSEAETAD
jgi:hypothetical protein